MATFIETLQVTTDAACEVEDPEDDLTREVVFYNLALAAAKTARAKLEAAREPHVRPDDFYTTMLKDDGQMARVKEKLLFDKRRMEALAERKKLGSRKDQKKRKREAKREAQQRKSARGGGLTGANPFAGRGRMGDKRQSKQKRERNRQRGHGGRGGGGGGRRRR